MEKYSKSLLHQYRMLCGSTLSIKETVSARSSLSSMSEQDYSLLSSISHYSMLWQDGVNYDDFIYDLRALSMQCLKPIMTISANKVSNKNISI